MVISKTVLISGGSSGIGFTISRYFAKAGYTLLWVALLKDEITASKLRLQKEFSDCQINFLVQDLSVSNAAQKVYDWVKKNKWNVDVLINNAGFGTYGFINDTDSERELNMINVNIVNLYKMTRLFLKDMITNNQGTIINISSNTSFQPTPKLSTYGATKSFVNHFTRSVHEELKILNSNVKVICVCPSAIKDTNFKKTGKMEKVKTFNGLATTTSEEVAKDIWNGFIKGKSFIVSGWKMRMLHRISGIVPYRFQQFLVRREIKEAH
ncbi:SDR family NAD(P)-dependent oxidoreductase [Aquimarina sp. 2201CG14-23]|uniref:SDR family NAD(P)-dependent oxidoreductase n=1 Tax=Aquimarina mycalae TaxID=3040073 RepID=UPI002477E83C|nr:SDR family NAD(P)-dependent oxidoreductase [Aquimarina sp. 2201CG14-23]MDH7447448.1 SDR family NAD(P)-dependent oxidoreductase [Aquimarina sp. 2201CG14-23]